MKVALITETFLPQINGIVRTLEKIVKHLEKNGHEVEVIAIGEGDSTYSKSKVTRVPGIKFALYEELNIVAPQDEWIKKILCNVSPAQVPYSIIQSLLPMPHPVVEEAIERFKPDIVHLVTPATLCSIGYYYVDKLNLPCLSSFHTDLSAYTKQYQIQFLEPFIDATNKMTYNRTDRVLAPSESTKKQLEKVGIKNIGLFGRGVDTSLFNPNHKTKRDEIFEKYNLDKNKTTIMYAGRLAEEKSLPILADAFLRMHEEYNLQLFFVGDGPYRKKLEKKLKDTATVFAGFKKGEEYAELFGAGDIFAFPSKTETFGQVVLEAMASGLPVLGFDSPGVRDLVKHSETGLLAEEDNNIQFENFLKELIENIDLRKSYGSAGTIEAEKRSWDNVLNELIANYQKVIDIKKALQELA